MGSTNDAIRKLITSFAAITIISISLGYMTLVDMDSPYNMGNKVMGWTFFYGMYVGPIILIYGNAVSIGLEYVQNKWFRQNNVLYILLHGVFGLANGLLFQSWNFALLGITAALLYAIIDRWVYKRLDHQQGVKQFFLIPVLIYALSWGVLQLVSLDMPPFTKEDAVEFATSGEGTIIEIFPEKIGKWEGTIDGYQVVRETNVKEVDDEKYIVTFTESWEKDAETGSRYFSYEVERGTLTAHKNGGGKPPY
ncbi:hypothetical protein [Virgibacillus doumboii]|uniref:hypothetical protein n=1 Tax=Virgibacillus doumboii TaxID=2697503 RepID=UPI001FE3709E|nr:hypothetical protein [Virgibacillus doumboii]